MKNGLVLLAIVLSVAAFGGMMRLKTDVQTLARERGRLVAEQMQLKETKRVLEAELAHLTNPDRLLKLAKKRSYIEMVPGMVVPMAGVSATAVSVSAPAAALL